MLLGMILGTLALVILFGVRPLTLPIFLVAATVAGAYFVAVVCAPFFLATAWVDPAFRDQVPQLLGLDPQRLIAYGLCSLLALGVFISCIWNS